MVPIEGSDRPREKSEDKTELGSGEIPIKDMEKLEGGSSDSKFESGEIPEDDFEKMGIAEADAAQSKHGEIPASEFERLDGKGPEAVENYQPQQVTPEYLSSLRERMLAGDKDAMFEASWLKETGDLDTGGEVEEEDDVKVLVKKYKVR